MPGKSRIAEKYEEAPGIKLSGGDALLVHCAHLSLSPKQSQTIKEILSGQIDWDLLINKATWHRLLPLVSHHLRSPDFSIFVPAPVLARMTGLQYHSLARNMVLLDELSRLLSAFNDQEMPVIVLKGAALLETIYRDISLRPMGDLDILVRPEHLDHAEAIALAQGYRYRVDNELRERTKKNTRHLANLWHPKKQVMLEIHHHIVSRGDPYYFDLDGFWARANTVTISGVRAMTLAPEDSIIHLSISFLLDRRYRSSSALGQLCDISEVITHYGDSLDWNLIEKTSRENGLSKGLYFVLYTGQQLLQTPVPSDVLGRFKPSEFDPASVELFIRRRVLDIRPWLAHGLVDAHQAFSRRRMVLAIAGRFSQFVRGILKKNGNGDVTEPSVTRLVNLLPQLFRVLFRPGELKEDLQLDRWLHDIYNPN